MKSFITGIHHITAVAADPQTNIDFYSGFLGLRMVKKTVNFDDPSAYHLYYGDGTGSPGTIVTFFCWPGKVGRGRVGAGQVMRLSFSATPDALEFWSARLANQGIEVVRNNRFHEDVLMFADPDGIPVEIVSVPDDPRPGWTGGAIPEAFALRGLHTAELTLRDSRPTEELVTGDMGYRLVHQEKNRRRFENGAGGSGTFIDVVTSDDEAPGFGGVGTIHHVAWRVADEDRQLLMRERLGEGGQSVSPVRDRTYFRSIYYREPGGVLFEVATDTPGFAIDESVESLGTSLMLPPPFESARSQIEAALPALQPARSVA